MVAIIDEIMINFNSCANAKKALFQVWISGDSALPPAQMTIP